MKCPVGICDGSGFIRLKDYDGPGLDDEDNCPHTDYPGLDWTPEAVAAFNWCYNNGHQVGDSDCPMCGPDGVYPFVLPSRMTDL